MLSTGRFGEVVWHIAAFMIDTLPSSLAQAADMVAAWVISVSRAFAYYLGYSGYALDRGGNHEERHLLVACMYMLRNNFGLKMSARDLSRIFPSVVFPLVFRGDYSISTEFCRSCFVQVPTHTLHSSVQVSAFLGRFA